MRPEIIQEKVEIPQGVAVSIERPVVKAKGPKGEMQKNFFDSKIKIENSNGSVVFTAKKPSKTIKTMFYTAISHFRNMIEGVSRGFVYKLRIRYVHFPVTVKVEQNKVVINNFLGEKIPRKAVILDGVDVKVAGDLITVEGINIEKVSQTAANIEMATRITGRDRRRFQDGCYIIEKAGVSLL
ncbi:MAG: 50S ribosomal protein L6 [Nanoarchaeota archaeon]